MSTVPLVCPRCYKNLHAPEVVGSGQVRCDACGHIFPPGGAPLSAGSAPIYPSSSVHRPSAPHAAASFGGSPRGFAASPSPLASPPPQTPQGPSLWGCLGVVLGLGALMLSCCGCFGAVLYFTAPRQWNEPLLPPGANAQIPPAQVQPAQPQPASTLPGFSEIPSGVPTALPGTAWPRQRSLDELLTAIKAANPSDFNSTQLLGELRDAPVEESRRGEVIDIVLAYLQRATPLSAGIAREALLKWAGKAQANNLAKFAAGNADAQIRRSVVTVIEQTGGDAETAKTLAPLLGDFPLMIAVRSALEKIGPEAEEALLGRLDEPNLHVRNLTYGTLGKVGGSKAKKRLQEVIDAGDPINSRMARKALSEIEQRESGGM